MDIWITTGTGVGPQHGMAPRRDDVRIAIYGKGGIGKSTMSANLSAAFARGGRKVLQIGCDPKQDSTRMLLGGASVQSVLDYVQEVAPEHRHLDDILHRGSLGTSCVEAGGPRPGVGCAGRGILTAFDLLAELGLGDRGFDAIIYDVLGDVVCGGFAVPMRKEHADAIFIVSSGEYMSIYAANNILRGVRNHDGTSSRVGGLILNRRGLRDEDRLINSFAKAVGLPVVARIPRSEIFARAEMQGRTVMELFPESEEAKALADLAEHIEKALGDTGMLYRAEPVDDDELERILMGGWEASGSLPEHTAEIPSPPQVRRELWTGPPASRPGNHRFVQGCAFAGAAVSTAQIEDTVTVVHGPASCADMVSHYMAPGRDRSRQLGHGRARAELRIVHTGMDERSMIFGGVNELESILLEIAQEGVSVAFVITTCLSGIIGDDVHDVVSRVEETYPGTRVVVVPSDGNIGGSYSHGVLGACAAAAQLIDASLEPELDRVNIIGERNLSANAESNFIRVSHLLSSVGLSVNCRFLGRTSLKGIREFCRGGTCLPAGHDQTTAAVAALLPLRNGLFPLPFPTGFKETSEWLTSLADFTDRRRTADVMVEGKREQYRRDMAELGRHLKGRKLLIASFSDQVGWAIDTALDFGMEVVRVGLIEVKRRGGQEPRYAGEADVRYGYDQSGLDEDIRALRPDLVLTHPPFIARDKSVRFDRLPFTPDVGFDSGTSMARRWANLIRLPRVEGWRMGGEP